MEQESIEVPHTCMTRNSMRAYTPFAQRAAKATKTVFPWTNLQDTGFLCYVYILTTGKNVKLAEKYTFFHFEDSHT